MNYTRTITTRSRQAFELTVDKLNRKAQRLGCPLIEYTYRGERMTALEIQTTDQDHNTETRTMPVKVHDYEVTTDRVSAAGWHIVGTIQATTDGEKNYVSTNDATLNRADYERVNPYQCQHCKTARHRNQTYLIRHDNGGIKQVGRNCLIELAHGESLAQIEFQALIFERLADEDGGVWNDGQGRGAVGCVRAVDCVALAEALRQEAGRWTPNQYDRNTGEVIEPGTQRQAAMMIRMQQIQPRHAAIMQELQPEAARILAEVADLTPTPGDEFEASIIYAAGFEYVPEARAGLVAYAGEFLRRYKAKKDAPPVVSEYIAIVGERVQLDGLKLIFTTTIEGSYGTSWLYKFNDHKGRAVVYFASRPMDLTAGETVNLMASIKRHEERDGIKQTTITRAKITSKGA